MNLKILIDGRSLLSPLTGIGRYTHEISQKLVNLEPHWDYRYYYGYISDQLVTSLEEIKHYDRLKKTKVILKKIPYLKKIVRRGMDWSRSMTARSYDLHWQPNFIPLSGIKAGTIVSSVHDFSWIHQEAWHPKERIEYFQANFWKEIPNSHRIITGSEYTKKEIVHFLNYDPDKIDVIYHGVDHKLFRVLDQNISTTLSLPKKFILAVGSMEPRKNLMTLLQAYTLLHEDLKREFKLVLIGFKGWNNQEIMHLIDLNKEHIIYLGYVSDEELALAYNRATLFVYPSLYEGFGIPPLEAMACGTAVIASYASSLPEVCGDAAVYIDPSSVEELCKSIQSLLEDNVRCAKLIDLGLKRAQLFSWEKSTQAHHTSFLKALSR